MVDNYKKFHQTLKSISHNFVYDRKNDEKLKTFYCKRGGRGKDKKKHPGYYMKFSTMKNIDRLVPLFFNEHYKAYGGNITRYNSLMKQKDFEREICIECLRMVKERYIDAYCFNDIPRYKWNSYQQYKGRRDGKMRQMIFAICEYLANKCNTKVIM